MRNYAIEFEREVDLYAIFETEKINDFIVSDDNCQMVEVQLRDVQFWRLIYIYNNEIKYISEL